MDRAEGHARGRAPAAGSHPRAGQDLAVVVEVSLDPGVVGIQVQPHPGPVDPRAYADTLVPVQEGGLEAAVDPERQVDQERHLALLVDP